MKAAAQVLVKAYNKQKCDAVGLGDRDLAALGVEELKKLASQAEFPFLNANVRGADGSPVFSPYVVLEKAGYKIGVFALVTPEGGFSGTEEYTVMPPIDAAREVMIDLEKEQLDAIVLLAHMERPEAESLVQQVGDIDILLGGQSAVAASFPGKMGDGWWIDSGQKGQYLNIVQLHVDSNGHRSFVMKEDTAKLQRDLASLDRKLERYEALMNRPAEASGKRDDRSRIEQVIARTRKQREELAARAQGIEGATDNAPYLTFEAVPMRKNLRDDDEVGRWIKEFKSGAPAGCGG